VFWTPPDEQVETAAVAIAHDQSTAVEDSLNSPSHIQQIAYLEGESDDLSPVTRPAAGSVSALAATTPPAEPREALTPVVSSAGKALAVANAAAPAPVPERFTQLEQRLRALGATHYKLETWGANGELYRFCCLMQVADKPHENRYHESTHADAFQAMETVRGQMERHVRPITDEATAEACLGKRVRFVGVACGYEGGPRVQTEKLSVFCDSLNAWPKEVWGRSVEAIGILVRPSQLTQRTDEYGRVIPNAGGDYFLTSVTYTVLDGE
jgi:hypothetical protein